MEPRSVTHGGPSSLVATNGVKWVAHVLLHAAAYLKDLNGTLSLGGSRHLRMAARQLLLGTTYQLRDSVMCWRAWDQFVAAKQRWRALSLRQCFDRRRLLALGTFFARAATLCWAVIRHSRLGIALFGRPLSVFDNIDRTTIGAATRLSSAFNYLNTSNRVEAARVRALLDDLFQRYPAAEQNNLKRRLRSVDNITHSSAFFELVLHELLLRSGCEILAVEPDLPGSPKKPDFIVNAPSGEQFYLEATLATGRSTADESAQTRLNQALQIIDSMGSPTYFLDLSIAGMPTDNIPAADLRRRLKAWMRNLNYDNVVSAWERDFDAVPRFDYTIYGLEPQIRPYPRNGTRGDSTERAIGVQSTGPYIGSPELPVRKVVTGKAGKYGVLDLPYVIAVDSMHTFARETHMLDALFGSPAVEVYNTEDGPKHRHIRQPDGVWHGAGGPKYTRVSGVISTERVDAWHVGLRRARLILNPWAARPATFLELIAVR
jgi:hypothetical protein